MLWESIMEESYEIAMECQSYEISRRINQNRRNIINNNNEDCDDDDNDNDNYNYNYDDDDDDDDDNDHIIHNNNYNHHRNNNLDITMNDDLAIEELSLFADDNASCSIGHEEDDINVNNNVNNVANVNDDIIHSPLSSIGGLLLPERSPRRFQIVQKSKIPQLSQGMMMNMNRRKKKMNNNHNDVNVDNDNNDDDHDDGNKMVTPAKRFRVLHSLSSEYSSEASLDDEYMELFELESLEDNDGTAATTAAALTFGLPTDLNSLINGQIIKKSPVRTPERRHEYSTARRCLTMTENNQSKQQQTQQPKILQPIMECTNKLLLNGLTPVSTRNCHFKRPEPPESLNNSPIQSKRYRINDNNNIENLDGSFTTINEITTTTPTINESSQSPAQTQTQTQMHSLINYKSSPVLTLARPPLRKSMSMNDAEIMSALARSDNSDEPDLIGDFTKPYILPLVNGRHRDLKSISSNTVARLLRGEFDNNVATYKIIDCRYPYEYEGGHIRGAKNLYTQEQVIEEFLTNQHHCKTDKDQIHHTNFTATNSINHQDNQINNNNNIKRNIVIFHCEFSSERGPKLSRFLRNNDRARNTNSYPTLDYPEIYLLHNGYKDFYENYAELCEPHSYRPMLEPSYNEEYKHFRAKSKSWNGDLPVPGLLQRTKKSRLRLML